MATAHANTDDLAERVVACEEALDLADRAINTQADTIQMLDSQNARLQKALELSYAEQAQAEAWYRSPELVGPLAFVLGVALGAYAIGGAR